MGQVWWGVTELYTPLHQDWEAVVLIPFIDEKRLLDAMRPRIPKLTLEEAARYSQRETRIWPISDHVTLLERIGTLR